MNSFMESSFLLFPACINTDEKRWINNQNPDIQPCSCLFSREENLNLLKELRDGLEAERAAERGRLEAQKGREMEQLKVELDTELQTERRNLQEEREDTLVSVKQVTANDIDLRSL